MDGIYSIGLYDMVNNVRVGTTSESGSIGKSDKHVGVRWPGAREIVHLKPLLRKKAISKVGH